MSRKAILSWSGGKDSALAFYELKKSDYDITLLTTITEDYDRISMHGVQSKLLYKQAESLGVSLEKVLISKGCTNEEYDMKMRGILKSYQNNGGYTAAFGDIFLEDIRDYREKNLAKIDMESIFPLWGKDTRELAYDFINLGFEAIITCVDTKFLDETFAGCVYDKDFLTKLPPTVDPCGENGEFHTFVYNGPIFKEKIHFSVGDTVLKENRFFYCDLY